MKFRCVHAEIYRENGEERVRFVFRNPLNGWEVTVTRPRDPTWDVDQEFVQRYVGDFFEIKFQLERGNERRASE